MSRKERLKGAFHSEKKSLGTTLETAREAFNPRLWKIVSPVRRRAEVLG